LLDQISKLIKNNKKHFEKDPVNEELIANLKTSKKLLKMIIYSPAATVR